MSAEDGEDGACGGVAVCFDGESVVFVARAAVDDAVDALRHPARARATGTRRLAAAFGREARVATDDDEEAVVFEANVLAMCFTRGGAMACAMDDGRVATRSASGGDAGTRRARRRGEARDRERGGR